MGNYNRKRLAGEYIPYTAMLVRLFGASLLTFLGTTGLMPNRAGTGVNAIQIDQAEGHNVWMNDQALSAFDQAVYNALVEVESKTCSCVDAEKRKKKKKKAKKKPK